MSSMTSPTNISIRRSGEDARRAQSRPVCSNTNGTRTSPSTSFKACATGSSMPEFSRESSPCRRISSTSRLTIRWTVAPQGNSRIFCSELSGSGQLSSRSIFENYLGIVRPGEARISSAARLVISIDSWRATVQENFPLSGEPPWDGRTVEFLVHPAVLMSLLKGRTPFDHRFGPRAD
jgi:hypothetical protein